MIATELVVKGVYKVDGLSVFLGKLQFRASVCRLPGNVLLLHRWFGSRTCHHVRGCGTSRCPSPSGGGSHHSRSRLGKHRGLLSGLARKLALGLSESLKLLVAISEPIQVLI